MKRFMLLSAVLLAAFAQTAVATPILENGGFDQPEWGAGDAAWWYTTGTGNLSTTGVPGWTFGYSGSGAYDGLMKNGAWGLNVTDRGAFVEGTGWISQEIEGFFAGTFTVSFSATTTDNQSTVIPNPINVTLDGVALTFNGDTTVTPPSGTSTTYTSQSILIAAGTHTLTFVGTAGGIPPICGIDNVSIAGTSTIPEPSAVVLLITGIIGLLAYAWRKRK